MAKRKRPIEGVSRRYVWKLYPTAEQDDLLRKQAAMCAELWNALLDMCERRHQRATQGRHCFHCAGCAKISADTGKLKLCDAHKMPSEFDMGYWISEMLAECPEWRALSTWTPRRVAGSLAAAFQAFFRRAKQGAGSQSGYPRFKSTRKNFSLPHRCVSGCAIHKSDRHQKSWTWRLKGVPGEIWARNTLPAAVSEWMDVDFIYRDGHWEASAAVAIEGRRGGGYYHTLIEFDLIDCFAKVHDTQARWVNSGSARVTTTPGPSGEQRESISIAREETPPDLIRAQGLQVSLDRMKSERDQRWPRGKRLSDEQRELLRDANEEISRLASRIARIRRNALHVWTTRIVRRASDLTVIAPAVKEHTKTPRGNEKQWGANIEVVSDLNRNTLGQAPATAVAMLKYKAEEAGIRCDVVQNDAPVVAVGGDLVTAGKTMRQARRESRRAA